MANPLPLPGLPPNNGARHTTFASFYGDGTLDPYSGDYARVMERLDPEVNQAVTPLILFEQAVGAGPIPQAYLCCALQQNQVRIYCIHLPSRYIGSMDGQVTPWDGSSFAALGEITHGVVTTVGFPNTSFSTVLNVRAKTSDYILNNLATIGNKGFRAILQDEPEAEMVSTRRIMYLPARYAALFLNPSGYTLRQAWELLLPALVTHNDLAACASLIKWLRVVSMGTVVQNNANDIGPSTATIDLQSPLADEQLINHRQRILKQVLPALYQPAQTLELAITQMAAAVTQNTNDSRMAREEKQARLNEPKLPSDRFNRTLNILLNYLDTPEEANLPPLWHQWSNCTKKQEFLILNDLLHSYSRGPEAFSTCTPVVNLRLVQDLLNFSFVSETVDDLKIGLQPFIIADGSAEHRQANLELARTYGMLNSGEQSLMLADLEALKSKEVQSIPLTYFELERNLGMFGNLLGTVLGPTHQLTIAYRAFWTLLAQGYRLELQQIIDNKGYIKPAHVLRSIQLICYNWFNQKRHRLTPTLPDFAVMLQNITLNTYMLPHLPPTLYKLAYPRPTTSLVPNLLALSDASHSSSSGNTSGSSNASTISNLTSPSGSEGTQPTHNQNQRRGSYIANLPPDTALQSVIPPGIKIKDLMGADRSTPPPLLDNGSQVCLSFLTRQGCWSTCRRANSHAVQLNPNERQRVVTYLRAQLQQMNKPRNPPTPAANPAATSATTPP
jgi:hypothetical protein